MGKLDNKVAIITGGAQGLGRSTVELFAQEGATVVIADILDEAGNTLAQSLGDSAQYVHLDVTDEAGWKQLAEQTVNRYGRIDVLINNAAVYGYFLLEELPKETFQQTLNVNVTGPFLGMQNVVPYMKKNKSGSIVNISSVDGLRGSCGMSAYNSSKWAVRGLTKCIAMEVGPFGIRVNSVHPGAMNTPMLNPEGEPNEVINEKFPGVALSRVSDPMEVARAILFLASDESSYVSGAELAVDGAWTCGVYLVDKPGPD
jgi:3alpha(or 20beta)-hydroxysteroid dehydrogenase